MDVLLEQFNIDPAQEYYESIRYFEESYKYDDELISMVNEATTGVTKQNIVQKFFNFIKKIIAWIIKAIKSLITKIKTLFVGKKKSADQALSDAGIEMPTSSNKDAKSSVVKIVSTDSKGVETSVDYEVAAKDLFVKIDGDVNKLIFKYAGLDTDAKFNNEDKYSKTIREHAPAGNETSYQFFVYFFNNKSEMNELVDIIETLVNVKNLNEDETRYITIRLVRLINRINKSDIETTFEIDMKTLQEYNDIYVDLHNKIGKIDIPDFSTDRALMEKFTKICDYLTIIQFGFNRITNAIYRIYDVDARYIESAKSVDSLGEAVYALIKAGIPHNHVARNTYLIADKKLRKSSDINDPARGQSRMVLLPEDESIVYKVALNVLGISDNSKENKIFEVIANGGFDDCVAKSLSITNNKCIETMERASTIDVMDIKIHQKEFNELDSRLSLMKDKINVTINDLHAGNFGRLENHGITKFVVIDYGQTSRSAR